MSRTVVLLLVAISESILLGLAVVKAISWVSFAGATIASLILTAGMAIFSLGNGLIGRRLRVFAVAVTIFADYKMTQQRAKWAKSDDKQDELWDRAHERNARRVFKAILKLEGLWVKAGQYLSTRADVLPEPYIRCLRLLQDRLPPRPLHEVLATIESEMGRPVHLLYDRFDNEPLATASIAQVHRALAKDGLEVVVKVQHSGVKERILQDLENLRTIVEWVAWSEPSYNFAPVVEEWCVEVPKELDFVNEAENTRKVAENLSRPKIGLAMAAAGGMPCCFCSACSSSSFSGSSSSSGVTKKNQHHHHSCELQRRQEAIHVDVLLPEVVQATEKVLVLSYMEGVRLNDAEALEKLGVDTQALVESITRAYAHQIYIDGFFNADPHPGNFLVSREPPYKPVLLDFGLVKSITAKMKVALAKLLVAAAENDYAGLLSSFDEMGLKLNMDMPEDAMAITSFFFPEGGALSRQRGRRRRRRWWREAAEW